jgi:hypothetical protein
MIIQYYVKLILLLNKSVSGDKKDTIRPLFQIPCHITFFSKIPIEKDNQLNLCLSVSGREQHHLKLIFVNVFILIF